MALIRGASARRPIRAGGGAAFSQRERGTGAAAFRLVLTLCTSSREVVATTGARHREVRISGAPNVISSDAFASDLVDRPGDSERQVTVRALAPRFYSRSGAVSEPWSSASRRRIEPTLVKFRLALEVAIDRTIQAMSDCRWDRFAVRSKSYLRIGLRYCFSKLCVAVDRALRGPPPTEFSPFAHFRARIRVSSWRTSHLQSIRTLARKCERTVQKRMPALGFYLAIV
jgi:hypothetical protein